MAPLRCDRPSPEDPDSRNISYLHTSTYGATLCWPPGLLSADSPLRALGLRPSATGSTHVRLRHQQQHPAGAALSPL